MSATTSSARRCPGSTGDSSLPMPTDVAFTSTSAAAMSSSVPTRATGARDAASAARCWSRLTITISTTPARLSASTIERAAPPAPSTTTRARSTSTSSARSESTKPGPSVEAPSVEPSSRRTTVFTDRSVDAAGSTSSTAAATSALCGVVTARPPIAERAHRRHRRRAVARRDLERNHAPVDPGGIEGGVVQRRRQRVPHRRSDHGRQPRRGGDRHNSSPRSRARCTFASCCSSVTAKACPPCSLAST